MMAGKTSRTAPIGLLMAGTLLLCAAPGAAQNESLGRTEALAAEADAAMNQAIADGNVGRNGQACAGFKTARSLYIQADFNIPSSSTDANIVRMTKRVSKELQSKAELAGKYAQIACSQ
jgi:hypothetical protein